MADDDLWAELDAESRKPGPTMTITKAQYGALVERATRATTVPVDLLTAAKAVVAAYVREDGDEVAIAVTGSDRDHRQYGSMLALRAAIHSTPSLDALREQFVASNPPAVVARIAVWRLLGGDDDTHPWSDAE